MKYKINGKQLKCPHCDYDLFAKGRAQLNTSLATFLGLDWLNASSLTFTCLKCGRIEWFTDKGLVEEAQKFDKCPNCEQAMENGQKHCPKCGWGNYLAGG